MKLLLANFCRVDPLLPGSISPVLTIVSAPLPSSRDRMMTSLVTSLQYIIFRLYKQIEQGIECHNYIRAFYGRLNIHIATYVHWYSKILTKERFLISATDCIHVYVARNMHNVLKVHCSMYATWDNQHPIKCELVSFHFYALLYYTIKVS